MMLTLVTLRRKHIRRPTCRTIGCHAGEPDEPLHAADTGPAEQAMELLIDLACEMGDAEYFHSKDPVEAARFVVSHAVSALWQTMLDQHGFAAFAERATRRLIRWESEYGT